MKEQIEALTNQLLAAKESQTQSQQRELLLEQRVQDLIHASAKKQASPDKKAPAADEEICQLKIHIETLETALISSRTQVANLMNQVLELEQD